MLRRRSILPILGLLVLLPAAAEAQSAATRLEIVPQAGYAVFGDLWKGPVGTSIGARNGALYGVQVGLQLAPVLALTGNVAYANSDLEAGLPILGGAAFGSTETLYYDAGLQLRLPLAGSGASPFLQAGAGGVRHEISSGIIDLTSTSPAFHVGGGVDLALTPAVGLRLQVRDYIHEFDSRDAIALDLETGTNHTIALTAGLRLAF